MLDNNFKRTVMIDFLIDIGFTKHNVALLMFCPLGAAIGSFAHAISLTINPNKAPIDKSDLQIAPPEIQEIRKSWLYLRVVLGAILGLVIALYFIGSIQENISTVCKITALSILIGYAAPKIWLMQEILIINRMEEIVGRTKSK